MEAQMKVLVTVTAQVSTQFEMETEDPLYTLDDESADEDANNLDFVHDNLVDYFTNGVDWFGAILRDQGGIMEGLDIKVEPKK
jgi:hypothetical protein